MKKTFLYLFPLLVLTWYQCGSEDSNLSTEEIFAIKVVDIGNNQNASDLLANFKIKNPSTIKEIRAFLINPLDFPAFTSTKAGKLSSESYQVITDLGTDNQVALRANLKDVDGASIEQEVEYFLGFVVLMEEAVLLNTQIGTAKITDAHFLTGKFGGTWDDNIYTAFGISADLTLQGSTISGPFWYSSTFTSCCGGQNDGRISFQLSEEQINNFRYDQKLVSFMGGPCDGSYSGEGQLENFTDLVINFTGNDCEGAHTGGRIRLVKIE